MKKQAILLVLLLIPINLANADSFSNIIVLEKFNEGYSVESYNEALSHYEKELEKNPNNYQLLRGKGITLLILAQNMDVNSKQYLETTENALKLLYKTNMSNGNDPITLLGISIGFTNLGQYEEARKYLDDALIKDSKNKVLRNYSEYLDSISNIRFSNTEESKEKQVIPPWIKQTVEWWIEGGIDDTEFLQTIQFLIEKQIIKTDKSNSEHSSKIIPSWIKNSLSWWSEGKISDTDFLFNIETLIEKRIITVENKKNVINFEEKLKIILQEIKQKKILRSNNPNIDIIREFVQPTRDNPTITRHFPEPINDNGIIHYKIGISELPDELKEKYHKIIEEVLDIWETNFPDVKFSMVDKRDKPNVLIVWKAGDGDYNKIGHADTEKRIVEIVLGDTKCDGTFQSYSIETIKRILAHEIGHALDYVHSKEKSSIMYKSIIPNYSYCLLEYYVNERELSEISFSGLEKTLEKDTIGDAIVVTVFTDKENYRSYESIVVNGTIPVKTNNFPVLITIKDLNDVVINSKETIPNHNGYYEEIFKKNELKGGKLIIHIDYRGLKAHTEIFRQYN